MKRRQLAGWLTLLCLAAAGCAPGGQDDVRATGTASAGASAVAADLDQAPTDGTRSGRRRAPRRKLPGRFKFIAAGDGAAPDCAADLASLPPAFATSPAVWMSDIRGPRNLVFTGESALCLHGFAADRPVTVTVSDGRRSYNTTVQPAAGRLTGIRYEPAESLFNGKRLRVYGVGSGVMQSETWDFVPSSLRGRTSRRRVASRSARSRPSEVPRTGRRSGCPTTRSGRRCAATAGADWSSTASPWRDGPHRALPREREDAGRDPCTPARRCGDAPFANRRVHCPAIARRRQVLRHRARAGAVQLPVLLNP